MTREELQKRIEKKQKDIEKIEKRIQKWTTGMNEEAKDIVAACELVYDDTNYLNAFNKYKDYKNLHQHDSTVFRQDGEYNKGPDLYEAYSAYRDLAEAKYILNKYLVQLDKVSNFEEKEKIEIIWNFLQEWKKKAYQFYVDNVKLYSELYNKREEEWEKYKESDIGKNKIKYYTNSVGKVDWYSLKIHWERSYYSEVSSLTKNITINRSSGKFDENKLNKILDKDVQYKYEDFINRIKEKAGTIQDVSHLKMAANGVINGVVIGDKHSVEVETILAGGYNIQVLHYRVLVKIIS